MKRPPKSPKRPSEPGVTSTDMVKVHHEMSEIAPLVYVHDVMVRYSSVQS